MQYRKRYWQIAAMFSIAKLAIHLATFNVYELHRDELLYFNQGAYLSLGNASVPPLIGWIAFVVKSFFGFSVLGVKIFPALTGAASVLFIAAILRALEGTLQALVLACTAYLFSPGFLLIGSLFTVNVFDQFFWLVISFYFLKMIKNNDPRQWLSIGMAAGFAFLNKYLVVYLLAGFGVVMLFSAHRRLFLSKYFVLAVLLGLLIISPNVYWQYQHGWPVFQHIRELNRTQMVNMTYRNFLVDLFDLHYVLTFFWMAGLSALLFIQAEKHYRIFGWTAVVVVLLFLLSKGKAYYTLGLFPMLFAFSGYILDKYITKKNVLYTGFGVLLVFSFLAVPFSLPLLSFERLGAYAAQTATFVSYPFSRWEDGKIHPVSQVFSDMTGWEELVSIVHEAYAQIPEADKKNCTIYTERNYGYAGAVHFYGHPYGLPQAITFADSYVLWAPDTIARGPLIYIFYELAGMDNLFETCKTVGQVNNRWFRENGLKVFLCENPRENLQEIYKEKAAAEKQKMFGDMSGN